MDFNQFLTQSIVAIVCFFYCLMMFDFFLGLFAHWDNVTFKDKVFTQPETITDDEPKSQNIFKLEQEIFGIKPPNHDTAKIVSRTAKKHGVNVHDLELELGLVRCDPRTFEKRHPKSAKNAREARTV